VARPYARCLALSSARGSIQINLKMYAEGLRRTYGLLMRVSARLDWVLAGAFLAFGLLDEWVLGETMTRVHGSHVAGTVFLCCVTLPLAFRRSHALPVVCAVMGAIALDSVVIGKAPQGALVLFPTLIGMYSVASYAPRVQALIGFAAGLAGTIVEAALDPEIVTFGDLVVVEGTFFVFLGGAAWLGGRYIRSRRRDAERSEKRAEEAERDVHDRARAAVIEERARIARELHDVIAHSVSLMGVQAGAVERVLERDPHEARKALRSIQVTARESVGELGRLLGVLREDGYTPDLSPQPGLDALGPLVEQSRRAGIDVELSVEGEPHHVPAGVELSAYRVVQEALTNVRKHATGARAQVRLTYSPSGLEVCVEDDGGPGAQRTNGFGTGSGITGMRERVALYGGSLEAEARNGSGFVVRAWLPTEVNA
jgi:signal transduction histidine kinase